MGSADLLGNAALITFRCTQVIDNELFQMGIKTGVRAPASWASLLSTAQTAFTTNVAPKMGNSTLVGVTYSEWDTSGFVGFHQKASNPLNVAIGSASSLPPQLAVVVSLLDSVDTSVPVRNRRGRIYHGTVAASLMGSTGVMTAANANSIRDAWKAVGTAIKAITTPTGQQLGLCIASVATGKIRDADQIGAGVAFDTQRRRRRKMVESIAYVAT